MGLSMSQAAREPITRRSVIAGAAAAIPAAAPLPVPAREQLADPLRAAVGAPTRADQDIAALLAAHRTAVAAVEAAARHLCDVEEGVADDGGQDRGNDADDDPFLNAALSAFDAAWDAETRTAWALARVRPADLATAAALLRYAGNVEAQDREWPEPPDDDGSRNWGAAFHHNLAAALDGMNAALSRFLDAVQRKRA